MQMSRYRSVELWTDEHWTGGIVHNIEVHFLVCANYLVNKLLFPRISLLKMSPV